MPSTAIHLGDQTVDGQPPISGSPPVGETTSKYASSTSSDSTMKPTITNQCAAPTTPHLSIRVWPTVSTSIVFARVPGRSNRSGSGWPSRMTATIFRTARTASTTATAVMAAARTVVTIWTLPIELASRSAAWRAAQRPGRLRVAGVPPPHPRPDRSMTSLRSVMRCSLRESYPTVT